MQEKNSLKKVTEGRKTPSGPPEADIPRRPKSYTDLRALGWQVNTSLIPGGSWEVWNGISEELPSRPKSRNGLDDLKAERYGRGKGLKACGRCRRATKKPKELKDELDFADWCGEFEGDLQDANSEHKIFQYTLDSYLTTCNSLISTTGSTLNLLAELGKSFQTVHPQTSSFQETCSSLLTHQNHIKGPLDSISTNLHPFTELDYSY
ncbi:hypothetical protein HOY80DRAFT_1035464 [Tuber brumale]|nr:hypothetical protein HOY80DRAFT_1035464 [Tuber brumale]